MMKEDIEEKFIRLVEAAKGLKRRVRISIRESFQTEPGVVTYL